MPYDSGKTTIFFEIINSQGQLQLLGRPKHLSQSEVETIKCKGLIRFTSTSDKGAPQQVSLKSEFANENVLPAVQCAIISVFGRKVPGFGPTGNYDVIGTVNCNIDAFFPVIASKKGAP